MRESSKSSKGMQSARDRQKSYADLKRKTNGIPCRRIMLCLKFLPWKGRSFWQTGECYNLSEAHSINQGFDGTPRESEFTWDTVRPIQEDIPTPLHKNAPSSRHTRKAGVSVFTSRAWRRMLDIRGPLVHELILEFFSTFRFGQAILDLDTPGTLQFQLGGSSRRMSWRQFILALGLYMEEEIQKAGFGVYWAESAKHIPDKGDLRDYWMGISSAGDFLGTSPSYTLIRDPILRLCHRLIAYSIAGRSQAPEKVTVTDLFYLRWMDVGSVNVPYLLARYLRLFTAGRKSRAHISSGQFVGRLAEEFGLLTAKILGGLTVIAPELPIIDMTELPVATAGAPAVAEDAPIIDEGGQADLAPEQAPQQPPPPPLAHARTIPQSMARLEEDVHEIRQMMDRAGVAYTPYAQTYVSYQRHIRQRTGEAITSAAQQDPQQPDQ
ncbi:hypothetical protein Tco_0563461 [Tanacetum coccineum]